jgi:chromosomal replication initiator protein
MRKILKPEQIINIVADFYCTTPEKMLSNNRRRENVLPRQVAMYMMKYNTRMCLNKIGEVMQGNHKKPFHHTTVIHSIRVVFDLMETDEQFDYDMQCVQENITLMMRMKEKPEIIIEPEVKAKVIRMETMAESEKVLNSYL